MNVNYEYYRIFYFVAKYCNFTKAAKALSSSQPNITRAMNCLEDEMHCKLFIRTNRGVKLTPEGERLYTSVSAAIAQIQSAEEDITSSTSLEKGRIYLGVTEIALNILMLDILKDFHRDFPNIRLKIFNHSTPEAIRAVKDGETDFAVITSPFSPEPSLKAERLRHFQDVLVGGPAFSSISEQQMSLTDIIRYPLISLRKESATFASLSALFFRHGCTFELDTEVATTDQILPLVKNNLGLAFLPEEMVEDAIAREEIVRIRTSNTLPAREICLVYDPSKPISTSARSLREKILSERESCI